MDLSLTVQVTRPLWATASQGVVSIPFEDMNGYSHEIDSTVGYKTMQFTQGGSESVNDVWLRRLGWHVDVYDESMVKVWEGFVNEVELKSGALTVKRGPLLDVSNRVKVVYQTVTYNTNPPVGGGQAETSVANDTDSQDLYGILEENISGGTGQSTQMDQLRDTMLNEKKLPETGQTLNLDSPSAPAVTVSCLGYGALLGRFYYSRSGTGTVGASAKIIHILGSAPTVAYETTDIDTNTLAFGLFADGQKTGLGEIMDVVAAGDSSDNRWTFGIYNDRRAFYRAVPTTAVYQHYLGETAQRIENIGGGLVYPWQVRPAEWLIVADYLPGIIAPAIIREDPRAIFIESVRYTAPFGIQIEGGKTGKLAQKLAKTGLGGM